ncbi:MAG: hypothetical protein QXO69_00650 [archaeon]
MRLIMLGAKKRGVFFSMDAAAALLVSMVFAASIVVVMSASNQPSEDAVSLTRLARDVYEIKNINPSAVIPGVRTDCAGENNVAAENALKYDAASNSVQRYVVIVC